ncbi:MAG: hypothetical protein JWR51_3318 [Devosia sp.]|uniref:ArsR/SmtB family transcription factor n=1 Tax=Devosia sp. TaxID=1871048 RepID=UPI00262A760D|nr:hypothetical protein [Devosia sp.]MDB5530215.1 hypothetical protein [Devosia sp.]
MYRAPFPAPFPGDPDYIFDNAVFQALGHPSNRHILKLLSVRPMTEFDLAQQLADHHSLGEWLPHLVASGLVGIAGSGHQAVYRLERAGLARVARWISSFDP